MKRRLLLILAVALALAWTAWLGYQALTTADPIVVSRPQVMAAPVVVVATLDDSKLDPRPAVIVRVYRGEDLVGADAEAKKTRILVRGPFRVSGQREWNAGTYILPLRETENQGEFEVMPPPITPGFSGKGREAPPIYPDTSSTEYQVREALRQFQRAVK